MTDKAEKSKIQNPKSKILAILVFLPLPLLLGLDLFTGSEYNAAGGSLKSEDFMILYNGGKLANAGRALDAYNYGQMLTSIRAQIGEPLPDLSTTPQFATTWPIYLYSPPATVVFGLLARLPYWYALAIWLSAGLAAMHFAIYLLRRALPYLQRHPYWVVMCLTLGFWPLNIVFTNGQNSAFTFLVYVTAFYLTRPIADHHRHSSLVTRHSSPIVYRPHRSGLLPGLIASALALQKPQLLLGLLLMWLLTWNWRALMGLAGGVIAAYAVTLLVLPAATFGAWIGNLLAFSSASVSAPIPDTDVTVRTLLREALPFAGGAANLLYYCYFALSVVGVALAVRRLNNTTMDPARRHLWLYVLAALFSVATPNYLLIYDLTLLLLPMLLLFALFSSRPEDAVSTRPRLMLATAALYLGIVMCHFIGIATGVQLAGVVSLLYVGYALYLFYRDTPVKGVSVVQT